MMLDPQHLEYGMHRSDSIKVWGWWWVSAQEFHIKSQLALCWTAHIIWCNQAQRRTSVSCKNNTAPDHPFVTEQYFCNPRTSFVPMSIQEKISTVDLMESLREELTCFICLDYFSGPVTTECGHSFCLMCLLKSWEEHNTPLSCPECWRTLGSPHFQANERLGRLASIGRQLRSQVLQNEDEQSSCGRTPGASWVFSDDEQSVINFSTQCHGINRTYFSSEAEEQHKVSWVAHSQSWSTELVWSLNSHSGLCWWQP